MVIRICNEFGLERTSMYVCKFVRRIFLLLRSSRLWSFSLAQDTDVPSAAFTGGLSGGSQ